MSIPVPAIAALSAAAMSPWSIRRTRAPILRTRWTASMLRSRSSIVTVMSSTSMPRAFAARQQRRPVDRVHGDVDRRAFAAADLLAVVEHRRFVLLAFPDDDDAVDRHRVEHQAHGVDRRAVGEVLLSPAGPPRGGE